VAARGRLTAELRSITIDLLGGCETDELPPEVAAWVEAATADVVTAVCEPSLQALIRSLNPLVAAAPRDVVRRLAEAKTRRDAGFF
jgi:hypothetical protein